MACGCAAGCGHSTPTPGGFASGGVAACPSWIPRDLTTALHANQAAVDAISLFSTYVASVLVGSVFLAPAAVPLGAIAVVLTSLGNNCDLGSSLTSTARQAALGCKIGAAVAGAATIALPPSIVVTAPIGGLLAALAPVLDAIGAGKTPKLGDVALFGNAAVAANGGHIPDPHGPLAGLGGVVDQIGSNKQVQGLVSQAAKATPAAAAAAPTAVDADAAYLEQARRALGESPANADAQLASFTERRTGVSGNARMHVLRFVAKWKAAGRPSTVDAVADLWDVEVPSHPFTLAERQRDAAVVVAKAKSAQLAAAAKARTGGVVATSASLFDGGAGAKILPFPSAPPSSGFVQPPGAPPMVVRPLKKLSTPAKVGIGVSALALLGLAVKVLA